MKYKKLPDETLLNVHGIWSLEPGCYMVEPREPQLGDVMLEVEADKYSYCIYGENDYTSGPDWLIHREGAPAQFDRDGTRSWSEMYECYKEEYDQDVYLPWPVNLVPGNEFDLPDGAYKAGSPRMIQDGEVVLIVSRKEACYYKYIRGRELVYHREDGPARIWAGSDPFEYSYYIEGELLPDGLISHGD